MSGTLPPKMGDLEVTASEGLRPHHMGEALVAELLRTLASRIGDVRAIDPDTGEDTLLKHLVPLLAGVTPKAVHPNASLEQLAGGVDFDGMHAIDCAVELDRTVVALELQLGRTRLRPGEFKERFSDKKPDITHDGRRLSGSMVAVLDANGSTIKDVRIDLFCVEKPVERKWILVVGREILDLWTKRGRMKLADALGLRQLGAIVSLEDIVAKVGVEPARQVARRLALEFVNGWFAES